MADFRKQLYDKYMSTYKFNQPNMDQRYLKGPGDWYRLKMLPLLKGLNYNAPILELGCGCGGLIDFLKKKDFTNVQGIDTSTEQISIALNQGFNVKVADVFEYLDSTHDSFDAIIAIDFIEHFTKEEIIEMFGKLKLALRKNGILILTTPNGQGLLPNQVIYGDFTHMTILSPQSLKQILTFFEFNNIKFYETGPVPKNVIGFIRLFIWQVIKFAVNLVYKIEANNSQQILTQNFICCCQK